MQRSLSLRSLFVGLLAGVLGLTAQAQGRVDIGLYQREGHIDVTVRPQQNFDGIFSAVVFTIRWDASTGATLGAVKQEPSVAQYMAVAPSGSAHAKSNVRYQVYAGFGLTPMSSLDQAWEAGQEYVIASIPVQGRADFELVNDSWTGEPKNNGDYYLSLGGQDRTGVIYKGLAPAVEGDVHVLPNPNNGQFALRFTNESAANTTIEIFDPQGKLVYNDAVNNLEGEHRRDLDLGRVGAGVYILKLTRGEFTTTHKVVVN